MKSPHGMNGTDVKAYFALFLTNDHCRHGSFQRAFQLITSMSLKNEGKGSYAVLEEKVTCQ